jgi:hypothetical protein
MTANLLSLYRTAKPPAPGEEQAPGQRRRDTYVMRQQGRQGRDRQADAVGAQQP